MLKTETIANNLGNSKELLKIENFGIIFDTAEGQLTALEEIDLSVFDHQTLGIIGESGSGKTTLATAIMGLIPENARVTGDIKFNDKQGNGYCRWDYPPWCLCSQVKVSLKRIKHCPPCLNGQWSYAKILQS